MFNRHGLPFVAATVAAMTTGIAQAATSTATFQVTANVQATCQISATNLGFGNYSAVAIPNTSTVTVTCTNGSTYDVGLNAGTATGATVSTRKMSGPSGALLNYGLFQDSGHATNWGNTPGTDAEHGTGNGSAQALTVFGLLPASQFVTTGAYTDTITATVTF